MNFKNFFLYFFEVHISSGSSGVFVLDGWI